VDAAASAAAIRRVLLDGGVPVWSVTPMMRDAEDVPWSWDVTSDSLSAWLAGRIGAKRVLLVKHVDPPAGPLRAADLVAEGIIDPAFPRLRAGAPKPSPARPAMPRPRSPCVTTASPVPRSVSCCTFLSWTRSRWQVKTPRWGWALRIGHFFKECGRDPGARAWIFSSASGGEVRVQADLDLPERFAS
jgi:hypothetical protein